jgi:photosystem II stability/assembly factor-like uncharacterized protein
VDVERELSRVLHAHAVPVPTHDPVPAVRAGMRRRRRAQRLQTVCASVAVLAVAGTASWLLSGSHGPGTGPQPVVTQPGAEPAPTGFRAGDLSWVSVDDGFAVGTAPCAQGRCVHVLRTADGGVTWSDTGGDGLPSSCAGSCPTRVRFADTEVGYLFGPTLFMTTDGGATWTDQPGASTYGLETARGTAVRLVTDQVCPGCRFELQRSPVGTADWATVHRSDLMRSDAALVRQVHQLVAALEANPAGGAGDAHTTLLLSQDDGTTWTTRPDPCGVTPGNAAGEVDATRVVLSLTGEVVALCQRRERLPGGGSSSVTLSGNGGVTFGAPTGLPAGYDAGVVAAAGEGVLLAETYRPDHADAVVLQRSTDGGRTWTEVARAPLPGGDTDTPYLAFSTTRVATWVPQPGSAVWRTSDGGATWTEHPFG